MLSSVVSGIDEAGRGSVFGSLFIVGVTLDEKSLDILVKNGLKDSKLYLGPQGRKKRSEIALKIKKIASELIIVEIPAIEIDNTLNDDFDNLNLLEIRYISELVLQLSSKKITIDTLSSPTYLLKQLSSHLIKVTKSIHIQTDLSKTGQPCFSIKKANSSEKKVIISKQADRIFPVVSAASCVAKYSRDQGLRDIEAEWNLPQFCLGQGYPSKKDQKVMNFLKSYHEEISKQHFPFIRYKWSWFPLQQIIQSSFKTLDDYLEK
ncbi:MAG: hypothetical protein ACXAC8_12745 [Candidatus Hodarchaeales archaeon]|jgi:ribonuclease HII